MEWTISSNMNNDGTIDRNDVCFGMRKEREEF
jgi:hypothetical protein